MILKYPFSRPKRAIYLFLNYVSLLNFFIHSFTILLFSLPTFFVFLLFHNFIIFSPPNPPPHFLNIFYLSPPPPHFYCIHSSYCLPTHNIGSLSRPFWPVFGLLGLILAILPEVGLFGLSGRKTIGGVKAT